MVLSSWKYLGWVILFIMAYMEVTHWYAFDGWAALMGTRPSHMPGTLVKMAKKVGPPETVHWSTCLWPLQLGDLGYLDFLHGISGLQKWIFLANKVKITWTFMTFSFRSPPAPYSTDWKLKGGDMVSSSLWIKCQKICSLLQKTALKMKASLWGQEGLFSAERAEGWVEFCKGPWDERQRGLLKEVKVVKQEVLGGNGGGICTERDVHRISTVSSEHGT